MFDDDALHDLSADALHDLAILSADDTLLRHESLSSISSPSTVGVDETLYVSAFCTFNGAMYLLEYPRDHNGWSFRPTQSAYSQLRWDLQDTLAAVCTKTTCQKAQQQLCSNCQMKSVWHRQCGALYYQWYIRAIGDATDADCIRLLGPLVYETKTLSAPEMNAYFMHMPLPPNTLRRVIHKAGHSKKMLDLQVKLQNTLLLQQQRARQMRQPSVLDLMAGYLNESEAGTDMTPSIPTPATEQDMRDTYSELLPVLSQPFTVNRLRIMRSSFRCDPAQMASGHLPALDSLSRRLGGGRATLVVCSRLESWLDQLEATASGNSLSVRIGVATPMTDAIRDEILSGTSPGNSTVIVNPAYLKPRRHTSAILVAYYPCPSVFDVPISSVLPLGIL